MTPHTYLSQEWQSLHRSHEQHERNALHTKLACVALFLYGVGLPIAGPLLAICVVLLWITEAIFKTYQGRITDRLLHVEGLLSQADPEKKAMQLYSEWSFQRPGQAALLANYALSALRPTVAFPYVPLLVLCVFVRL